MNLIYRYIFITRRAGIMHLPMDEYKTRLILRVPNIARKVEKILLACLWDFHL